MIQTMLKRIKRMNRKNKKGFTLVELLLVIAIIAILAAIVIIAINPARQIAQANNAQRRVNINSILNGVNQYMIDNRGTIPTSITTSSKYICITGTSSTGCGGGADLAVITNNELYLVSLPTDPTTAVGTSTGYLISKSTSSNPRVTVSAPGAELSVTISVTR